MAVLDGRCKLLVFHNELLAAVALPVAGASKASKPDRITLTVTRSSALKVRRGVARVSCPHNASLRLLV